MLVAKHARGCLEREGGYRVENEGGLLSKQGYRRSVLKPWEGGNSAYFYSYGNGHIEAVVKNGTVVPEEGLQVSGHVRPAI